jgi:hypothetical protein
VDADVRVTLQVPPPSIPAMPAAPPIPTDALKQLQAGLQSPTLLCVAAQQAFQDNEQLADACNQVAGALQPVTGPAGAAVAPVLGALP